MAGWETSDWDAMALCCPLLGGLGTRAGAWFILVMASIHGAVPHLQHTILHLPKPPFTIGRRTRRKLLVQPPSYVSTIGFMTSVRPKE